MNCCIDIGEKMISKDKVMYIINEFKQIKKENKFTKKKNINKFDLNNIGFSERKLKLYEYIYGLSYDEILDLTALMVVGRDIYNKTGCPNNFLLQRAYFNELHKNDDERNKHLAIYIIQKNHLDEYLKVALILF